MTSAPRPSVQSAAFADLLVESGLVTHQQVEQARQEKASAGLHLDEVLVAGGAVDRDELVRVMSRAWQLPAIDLALDRPDPELVREWPEQVYLSGNWIPVRDQANGTVLVATARIPDDERSALIADTIAAPIEFVVAPSDSIRAAARRVFGRPSLFRRR